MHKPTPEQAQWNNLLEKALDQAKKLGATQAEGSLSISQGLSSTIRMGCVETIEFTQDRAFSITVYQDQRKGSASANDFSDKALSQAVEAALRIARYAEPDPYSGLVEASELADLAALPNLDLHHPESVSVEDACAWAKDCEDFARAYDTRIVNSEGASFSKHDAYAIFGNSHGFLAGNAGTSYSLSCAVVAKDNQGEMQRDYDYTVSRWLKGLESAKTIGEQAALRTVKRLSPRKIKTGRLPVVFSPDVAPGLFSSFSGAISGGNLYRRSSCMLDTLGKQVFPEWMLIQERPHLPRGLASANFDQDGVATREADIVKEGILQTYLLGGYSARKLGMKSTGHASGIHNWLVQPTVSGLSELLQICGTGLFVTELMGFGVNIVTGDYSQGIAGFWVENGELQYPVQEVTIAGHLPEMFKHIVAIGGDVDKRRNIQTGSVLIEAMIVAGE